MILGHGECKAGMLRACLEYMVCNYVALMIKDKFVDHCNLENDYRRIYTRSVIFSELTKFKICK